MKLYICLLPPVNVEEVFKLWLPWNIKPLSCELLKWHCTSCLSAKKYYNGNLLFVWVIRTIIMATCFLFEWSELCIIMANRFLFEWSELLYVMATCFLFECSYLLQWQPESCLSDHIYYNCNLSLVWVIISITIATCVLF